MPNQNTQTPKLKAPDKPDEVERSAKKSKWDIIDEHAWESFPASDAPASWAGRDIAPADREGASDEEPHQQDQKAAQQKPKKKD